MQEDRTIKAIYEHAEAEYPKECCGIVTASGFVMELENVSETPYSSFQISARDLVGYSGGALFAYHSHPDGLAVASEADIRWAERNRLPLMIVSWPHGDLRMIGRPGKGKPLEGRSFIYGAYDCYSLVEDYYAEHFDYKLPTITRPRFGWWESGQIDPFTDGIIRSGFVDVPAPEPGDILVFTVNGSSVCNHIGVYVGNNILLHHGLMSLSSRCQYDADYRKATTRILRRAN